MNAATHLEKVITGEVSAVTHLEKVIAGETSAVTYTEKVITGEAPPITHLQKVIAGEASPVTHLEYVWVGGTPSPTEHEYTGAVPYTFTANGSPLISWRISGNTVQTGTPTPDNPVMPQGTGERTGNLLDPSITRYEKAYSDRIVDFSGGAMYIVPIKSNTTYTVKTYSDESISVFRIGLYNKPAPESEDTVENIVQKSGSNPTATITNTDYKYLMIQISGAYIDNYGLAHTVLNTGSTALPYEPYGNKIPISSANTTTSVYLGVVQTERKIQKLVFDGTETGWRKGSTFFFNQELSPDYLRARDSITCMCSHYPTYQQVGSGADIPEGYCSFCYSSKVQRFYIKDNNFATLEDFTTYLAQQYANGTPVCIWYVLATPETAVVNEPLMRIGDYADTVSMEQAGVSIPTADGSTTLDVETTVKPSEIYIKYKGV